MFYDIYTTLESHGKNLKNTILKKGVMLSDMGNIFLRRECNLLVMYAQRITTFLKYYTLTNDVTDVGLLYTLV